MEHGRTGAWEPLLLLLLLLLLLVLLLVLVLVLEDFTTKGTKLTKGFPVARASRP
jgi:hypothetical protein